MIIRIQKEAIDATEVIRSVRTPEAGAVVTFQGTVRRFSGDTEVSRLYYESYKEMAEKSMKGIADEAVSRFGIIDYTIEHRTGDVNLGEDSVIVSVSAAHREEAFSACKFIIDRIKTETPIWKKDIDVTGKETWRD
ncbi:MAG: molybdenum cofactor biosynthesis protein MoaE [Candidatus Thermoplasmatota archaeon]|nr:molybdenum cofactor biosynthesis protein MoaE [Candidatus Thermoplasmatota archaeon]